MDEPDGEVKLTIGPAKIKVTADDRVLAVIVGLLSLLAFLTLLVIILTKDLR